MELKEMKDLLHYCRYYKGEKENPFEGTKGMLWQWEKSWILILAGNNEKDEEYMSQILEDYIMAGLKDFEKWDGTPITLKALLYNRFDHWNESEGFESFYRKYYPSKKEMKDNYLLHHCRYYKGEEECPFTQIDDRFTAWKIEAMWVNMMVNDSEHLNFCLEEYLLRGMKDFQKYDDTPITLKALLMNRYFKYEEREDIEGFKKFYREFYGKSK